MFTTKARLNQVAVQGLAWKWKYEALLSEWNDLVGKVNALGGLSAIKPPKQFTDEEIKRLLMLCHPDKHDGKQMAVEMTQKLNAMRQDAR